MNKYRCFQKKLRGMLRSQKGFSLGETLVALAIVAVLTMGIATGVAFGSNQYRRSVIRSEAKVLCSTLASIIRNELMNTTVVYPATSDSVPVGFESPHYMKGASARRCFAMNTGTSLEACTASNQPTGGEDMRPYGTVCVADRDGLNNGNDLELIPAAAYSAYGLKATVYVRYNSGTSPCFIVDVCVTDANGTGQADAHFTVVPLNKLEEVTSG